MDAQLTFGPHAHRAADLCPWCGSTISRSKFIEIQEKIAQQERQRFTEQRTQMEREMVAEKAKMQSEEIKKIAAIRQQTAAEVESKLRAEATKKESALTLERDEAKKKLGELEKQNNKTLEQQRAALEKDRDSQILKVQVQHNREKEQMQQKVAALTRQLQRKTADELGDGAEVDVYDTLREAYPRDDIKRIKRGQPGADIRHEILYKGSVCGTILVDSKNRQGWQHAYVTKLREDQIAAKAEHAILATTVFPSGKKELYVDETGVVIVNRARVAEIIGLLRDAMIRLHVRGLSQTERAEKRDELYEYINSEHYRQQLEEACRVTTAVLELDVEEKREHDKVWQKRGKMTTRLRNVVREVDTEISAILEGRKLKQIPNA